MNIEDLARAIQENHAEFRELAVDYWGINKDNGKRSEIQAMMHRQTVFEEKCREFLYEDRSNSCPHVATIASHSETLKARDEEEGDVKIAKINSTMQIKVMLIGQALTLLGTVVMVVFK